MPLSIMSDAALAAQALLVTARCLRPSELALAARSVAATQWKEPSPTPARPIELDSAKRGPAPANVVRSVTFTGCGGLYTYLFGVAAYMQKHFDVCRADTVFASASAGAFPAFLLAAGLDVEEFHRTSNRELLNSVAASAAAEDHGVFSQSSAEDSRIRPLGRWNDAVREHFTRAIVARLGEEAHRCVVERHFISLTELPELNNALVADYASVHDLVEGFIASAYVPIYTNDNQLAASWREIGRAHV